MMKKVRTILLIILLLIGYSKTTAPILIDDSIKEMKLTQALNFLELDRYHKQLDLFINKLGYDESNNNWTAINTIGAFSEFQFMEPTLREIGYGHIKLRDFKKDPNVFPPELQKEALKVLIEYNSIKMFEYIQKYEGKKINNVLITKAGILAACHLGGPRSVKLYLDSNGVINRRDIYKTSIEKYLIAYQMFDLSLNLI